jgi:hypothetical protein
VHILLFASAMRLDIANRSVVLDSGVIALYGESVTIVRETLAGLRSTGLCKIMVNAEVMTSKAPNLWRDHRGPRREH